MSETTRKLLELGSTYAADAIDAVEAQVAEAVARVEKLEKRQGNPVPGAHPVPNGDVGVSSRGVTTSGAQCPVTTASPAAPTAVPAPRGFREGDRVLVVGHGDLRGRTGVVSMVGSDKYPSCRGQYQVSMDDIQPNGPRPCVWSWIGGNDLVRAADAPAETTRPTPAMEIDALRGEVARLTKERDEARAISAATAERVRNETQIATELRKDLDELRAKLTAAESDRDAAFSKETALRRDLLAWQDAATEARNERDEFKRIGQKAEADRDSYRGLSESLLAELDALRFAARTWFKEKGEPELLATAEEVTERRKAAAKELATLKAKPRFRTRAVTEADVRRLHEEFNKPGYDYSDSGEAGAMNAIGFRRRVDGAK